MISKIGAKRSNDPGVLINYLFGPGRANEHINQRTVAGSVHFPGQGVQACTQVVRDLRAPQRMWRDVKFPGGHIWHCSLSLAAAEGALSEAQWAGIANDFMAGMEFTGQGRAAVRWTAVHHGPSAAGNDHIHIVVNLVREDGTKVNIWQDMPRSQRVVQELEQKYGLRTLASRTAGVGNVPYTGGEVARSRATGRPIERVELERIVRATASASASEAEFVRRLRESGVVVRPFPPSGRVSGYSVGMPSVDGQPSLFFSGGKLARDLTLPKLRAMWTQSAADDAQAQLEWRRGAPGRPVVRTPVEVSGVPATPDALARALDDLDGLARDLASATREQLPGLSRDVAGALSAAASAAGPQEQASLRKAAREVAAWAGTRGSMPPSAGRQRHAALLFLLAMKPDSEWAKAYMLRQLIDAVLELHRLHRVTRSVVGPVPGRGVRMSTAQDDVDGVFVDGTMVAVTTTATIVATRAQENRRRLEVAQRLGEEVKHTRFRDRFTLKHDSALREYRDPLPSGLGNLFTPQEWAELDPMEARLANPDGVGRWSTDYAAGTPGSTFPATRDQVDRASLVAAKLDTAAATAAAASVTQLDRAGACQVLRRLESELGPDATRDAYHEAMMAYRREGVEDGQVRYSLEFPGSAPAPVDVPAAAPAEAPAVAEPAPAERHVPTLGDPSTWRSAGEPVTEFQAKYLRSQGHTAEEIGRLDKARASLVVRAHKTQGDVDGHAAMDKALADMERLRSAGSPSPRGPVNPTQGPNRTR